MGINIISLDEAIDDNGLKIMVYANAGTGKTVLCSTSGHPTILLSAEGGLLSLKKEMKKRPELKKLIQVIKIQSIDDLNDALQLFRNSPERLCNWIALDSISEIAEVVLAYEKENNKDARAAYGNLTTEIMSKLREFRDLPEYNVIMTAKMVRGEDSDGKTYYQPLFPGKGIAANIPYMFDEVLALRLEEEETETGTIVHRVLQTQPDTQYFAKDRSGELDEFEAPSLAGIFKKIRGFDEVNFEMDEESKARYAEKFQDMNAVSDVEVEESFRSETTYWHHIPSGEVMSASEGENVWELENNPEVEEITEEVYRSYLVEVKEISEEEIAEVEDEPEEETEADLSEENPDTPEEESEEQISDDEGSEESSEAEHEEEEAETETESSESDSDDEVISDKVQYWKQISSGDCMETEEDTNITSLLLDDDVVEITKKEFDKWKAGSEVQQTAPPKTEAKLQKAKREMEERQAAAKKK